MKFQSETNAFGQISSRKKNLKACFFSYFALFIALFVFDVFGQASVFIGTDLVNFMGKHPLFDEHFKATAFLAPHLDVSLPVFRDFAKLNGVIGYPFYKDAWQSTKESFNFHSWQNIPTDPGYDGIDTILVHRFEEITKWMPLFSWGLSIELRYKIMLFSAGNLTEVYCFKTNSHYFETKTYQVIGTEILEIDGDTRKAQQSSHYYEKHNVFIGVGLAKNRWKVFLTYWPKHCFSWEPELTPSFGLRASYKLLSFTEKR